MDRGLGKIRKYNARSIQTVGIAPRTEEKWNPGMAQKRKLKTPVRRGKPPKCVSCGKPLHRKSEYYCSEVCARANREILGDKAPPFLSKWKIRKRKEIEDPLILLRQKLRRKTRDLIRRGILRRGHCVVCGQSRCRTASRGLFRSLPGDLALRAPPRGDATKGRSLCSVENCSGIPRRLSRSGKQSGLSRKEVPNAQGNPRQKNDR